MWVCVCVKGSHDIPILRISFLRIFGKCIMDERTDGRTERPTEGQTDGQMDGEMDGQSDPLIEKHLEIST